MVMGASAICNDRMVMNSYYVNKTNADKFWELGADEPKTLVTVSRMLVLPPDCVVFCALEKKTPQYPWEGVVKPGGLYFDVGLVLHGSLA